MRWNFRKIKLKFINGEWWQEKEPNPQNNINIIFLILIRLFQKQISQTLKIDYKYKNQNWTLIQKSNEKKAKKQELVARPHILPFVFICRKKG